VNSFMSYNDELSGVGEMVCTEIIPLQRSNRLADPMKRHAERTDPQAF
jgi:hypothetical protein